MKDFAKSIRTMNSNKEEIIKKKKEEGATLKVDNGQKLEFSDGTTFVKTSFSSDYREAHNHVGNAKDKNGKDVNVGDLVKVKTDDPSLSLGKVKSVSGETIRVDMTGDDDIWTTPARLVEKVGNKKVGNEDYSDIISAAKKQLEYAKKFGWAETGYNGWTKKDVEDLEKKIKDLEQKQKTGNRKVGNEAVVLKDGDVWVVLYANETKSKEFDTEAEARAFAKQVGNKKVGNAQKLYSDANVEIYDDGIVKLSHFPGYTQWAKDVDSIVRDEIRALETQISDLKNAASKVKEVGKKYGLL